MHIAITLLVLVLTVLLCDKFEDRLFPPISWVYAGWKKFAHVLGIVMSFLILTILWIIGFGIYAIVLKIIRIFQSKKQSDTYWINSEPITPDSLHHQF